MSDRKEGFYWVRWRAEVDMEPARVMSGGHVVKLGNGDLHPQGDVVEWGDGIPAPDEYLPVGEAPGQAEDQELQRMQVTC